MILLATLAACGFGDDRHQLADDGGDDDVPPAVCGDGAIDPGEDCDDADTADDDGCDADCEVEPGWNCTGAPSDCVLGESVCGDGAIANGEDCDDDDTTSGDGCSAGCDVELGWECAGSPSVCNPLCGNGDVDPGEECDGTADCNPDCTLIATVACTLVPQSGCTGTAACDLGTTTDTACRAVTGNGTNDNLCASFTSCAAGFTCVEQDADVDSCMKFCVNDGVCPGPGARCVNSLVDETGDPIPGVKVCSNSCDPVAQTGCPAGLGCVIDNHTGGDISDCFAMGTRLDGQTCGDATDCRPGSLCVNDAGGGATCHEICEVGGPLTCGGGLFCGGFTDPVLIGGAEYGACF